MTVVCIASAFILVAYVGALQTNVVTEPLPEPQALSLVDTPAPSSGGFLHILSKDPENDKKVLGMQSTLDFVPYVLGNLWKALSVVLSFFADTAFAAFEFVKDFVVGVGRRVL